MAMMSWQYVAGFFDGEGSVGTASHCSGRKASAYIAQSGAQGLLVLQEINSFLAEQGIRSSVFQTGIATGHKRTMPSYRLGVGGFGSVEKFLRGVFPYLRVKKAAAQDILRYCIIFPNISYSPLAKSWRSEKQRAARKKALEK